MKNNCSLNNNKLPRFIDLFAGIGGFRLAFEEAHYQCVYSCEINDACRQVYFENFGEVADQDITKIDPKTLPDFEVLTAGFPCQPFSICGKRGGFYDTRGTLFFNICEIINLKKPPVLLLENVKHLLHHNRGKTLEIIIYSLEDLGYIVNYELLNSKNFGLPQNRERIIIIASKSTRFDFKKITRNFLTPKLRDFLHEKGDFEYLNPNEFTLIEQVRQQESGLLFVGYRNNKSIWKKGVRPNTKHLSRVHRQPNRIYSIDGVHPTLPSQETSGRFFIYIPEENSVRKLTIEECYKIMGFPENFKIHSSTSEAYKQVGNSVPIPMIYELALQIKEQILSPKKTEPQLNQSSISKAIQLEIPGLAQLL